MYKDSPGLTQVLRKIRRIPLLEKNEERELLIRAHKGHDQKARDLLVLSHMRLVEGIAARYKNFGIPREDLISAGLEGLLMGIDKFNLAMNNRLATYASVWVRLSIITLVMKNLHIMNNPGSGNAKTYFFLRQEIKKKLNIERVTEDTLPQVFEALGRNRRGISAESILALEVLFSNPAQSLSDIIKTSNGDKTVVLGDMIPDKGDSPEEQAAESELYAKQKELLMCAMRALSPRERYILNSRYLGGEKLKLDELGGKYGVSRERVRQIEACAIRKIKEFIEEQCASTARNFDDYTYSTVDV